MESLLRQKHTLAEQACTTCRKQKRRCTRELPECALCRKNRKSCDYSTTLSKVAETDDASHIKEEIMRLERQLQGLTGSCRQPGGITTTEILSEPIPPKLDFPPLFFLDHFAFEHGRNTIEEPCAIVPSHFSQKITNAAHAHHIADVYFMSTHTFFPIVSKIRTYQQLSKSPHNLGLDTILLLLAMELHATPIHPHESACSGLYSTVKECYAFTESQNIISVRLLQAGVLVAFYEIAHAIYPAAYLTIGNCARLGYAMGIHDLKSAPQMLPRPGSRNEQEERNRTWWGVMILERYVNVGSSNRPFACRDAALEDLLPMDDELWDQGEMTVAQPLAVSDRTAIFISPFARTCQASHLLSRVLRHLSEDYADTKFRYQEANQLHLTLRTLLETLSDEMERTTKTAQRASDQSSLFPALALCCSAVLSLYDCYSCAEKGEEFAVGTPEQLEMQKLALAGIHEVSALTMRLASAVQAFAEREGFLRISPLVADCMYQVAAHSAWLFNDSQNTVYLALIADIKEVLRPLGGRWRLANVYLKVIEMNEPEVT